MVEMIGQHQYRTLSSLVLPLPQLHWPRHLLFRQQSELHHIPQVARCGHRGHQLHEAYHAEANLLCPWFCPIRFPFAQAEILHHHHRNP
jgi:hypothetical protein